MLTELAIWMEGVGTKVPSGLQGRSPARGRGSVGTSPDAVAVGRRCLQILTTETIKIWNFPHNNHVHQSFTVGLRDILGVLIKSYYIIYSLPSLHLELPLLTVCHTRLAAQKSKFIKVEHHKISSTECFDRQQTADYYLESLSSSILELSALQCRPLAKNGKQHGRRCSSSVGRCVASGADVAGATFRRCFSARSRPRWRRFVPCWPRHVADDFDDLAKSAAGWAK